ncbi:hypothetical protein IG631_18607 [Alternaria alternata]|nr:hypothetical protein IG631_18607 [Alternaria alternata]
MLPVSHACGPRICMRGCAHGVRGGVQQLSAPRADAKSFWLAHVCCKVVAVHGTPEDFSTSEKLGRWSFFRPVLRTGHHKPPSVPLSTSMRLHAFDTPRSWPSTVIDNQSENKLRTMALDTQSIIAVIALLITCPPTIWLLYRIYTRRQPRHDHGRCRAPQRLLARTPKIVADNNTLLPTHASHSSTPTSRQNMLHHHQRYHTWSLHTTIMLEDLATAFNHDLRGKKTSSWGCEHNH